ncbi:MAG: hypothetical protein M1836_001529 [Candelina mexicana]|nr:MAG: hypothetical protein M1836_001529 [Candelina mexicana]
MATPRLRNPFPYTTSTSFSSSSSSDDETPVNLDEEEQDQLIHTLRTQNARHNKTYTLILLLLPLLPAPLYISFLFSPATSSARLGLTVLSLMSLGSTAWILYYIPPRRRGGAGSRGEGDERGSSGGNEKLGDITSVEEKIVVRGGPIQRYLEGLNAVICVLLGISAFVSARRSHRDDGDEIDGSRSEQWIVLLLIPSADSSGARGDISCVRDRYVSEKMDG